MNKQLSIWKFISENLREDIPVMVLYVLESSGSSPGRQGFFMAVNNNKQMEGSIGGGIMEHKFVELAKEKLQASSSKLQEEGQEANLKPQTSNLKPSTEIRKQVHDKSVATNQSGMICSGEQTIVLYPVQKKDEEHINNIIQTLEENKNGTLQLFPGGISFEPVEPLKHFELDFKTEEDWLYKEKLGYKNHLYIIGGGHCAFALSRIMSMMDFYIHLFEERKDLNTLERNAFVHEKKIVDDYSELSQLIPPGENNYVVVMTFGYRTDDLAVKALLHKQFKYFGLLGSKKKIEKMFSGYRNEGVDLNLLQKIHSPIGIQIKSETPEEIAVSIAAEIIKVKNMT